MHGRLILHGLLVVTSLKKAFKILGFAKGVYSAHIWKMSTSKSDQKKKNQNLQNFKNIGFPSVFHFWGFGFLPTGRDGKKPKPPISKTSQKPLLKNLSVFDFRFWGRFWRRQFSYMGDDTVEGEGAVTRPIPTQIFLTDPSLNSELPECCWHHECCI